MNYSGSGPFPVMEFAELYMSGRYPDFDLEVVPKGSLGDGMFGAAFPVQHHVLVPEDVYEGAHAGDGFCRMTVAHECVHVIWHEKVPTALARRFATPSLPAYRTSEWQAKALAGALLMPIYQIIHMSVLEIKSIYQVSFSAACVQREKALKSFREFTWRKEWMREHA